MSENPFSARNVRRMPNEFFAFVDGKRRLFPHHNPNGEVDVHHLRAATWYASQFDEEKPESDNPWGLQTLEERKAVLLHLIPHADQARLIVPLAIMRTSLDLIEILIKVRRSASRTKKNGRA